MRRREFLQTAGAVLGAGMTTVRGAEGPRRARRPAPPYRVWYQPRCFERDMSLYRNMTIDASGWLDPRLCELAGRTGLRWAWGTTDPDASGPEYWRKEGAIETRSLPPEAPELIAAGIALDEWLPPKGSAEVEGWVAEGLRAARAADPALFVAVWFTDLRPGLAELMREGTVDLAIIEGYTHVPARFGPNASSAWATCLRRCEAAAQAGVLDKTIFCFGHITDEPNAKGQRLDPKWLEEKAQEIKTSYPAMPGIAWYQGNSPDSRPLRRLVRHCDELSGRLWPDHS